MAVFIKKRQKLFLEHLSEGDSVSGAAKKVGVSRNCVYEKRRSDPEFKKAWEDAQEQGTDFLEDAATARAIDGSDTLLIFMLKSRRPEKYRERFDIDTNHRGSVAAEVKLVMDEVWDDDANNDESD